MTNPAAGSYPEQSQATTILILGIVSLTVCCGPAGIAAWIMANHELKAIDEGRRPPENKGTATVGRICGIIGLALFAIALVLLFFAVVVGISVLPMISWTSS